MTVRQLVFSSERRITITGAGVTVYRRSGEGEVALDSGEIQSDEVETSKTFNGYWRFSSEEVSRIEVQVEYDNGKKFEKSIQTRF